MNGLSIKSGLLQIQAVLTAVIMDSKISIIFFLIANSSNIMRDYHHTVTQKNHKNHKISKGENILKT